MGFGSFLKKLGRITTAPVRSAGHSVQQLLHGNVGSALKYGTQSALAPITQPAQVIGAAPGMGALRNVFPGANRLQAGLTRLAGGPTAASSWRSGRPLPPIQGAGSGPGQFFARPYGPRPVVLEPPPPPVAAAPALSTSPPPQAVIGSPPPAVGPQEYPGAWRGGYRSRALRSPGRY